MFRYNENYFFEAEPNILENTNLREPQIQAYYHAYEHFRYKKKDTHAVIVLPTGVGKTGVMALLPYAISEGRVLIITPQTVIRDTVIEELNPDVHDNFWLKRKIFNNVDDLPVVIEFGGKKTNQAALESANIVIVNVQKLQERLDSSPLNFLPDNFFDMIIIDEAHHSTAKTWVETTQFFSSAKVVKITGTPFRTDNIEIRGELIYKYKLSRAMANNYVKSLENITYIPEELYLTIDNDRSKKYSIEELEEMGIKDEDWISRSVAYSLECSKSVVEKSVELLKDKLVGTSVPHKIIAVASNIEHAKEIQGLYNEKQLKSAIIHSKMDKTDKDKAFSDIDNHRVQVVINVAMLGEGYDHPYLSIAAIFRAFKNQLPYAQFIGRILRVIPPDEVEKTGDNIGQIIAHRNLYLDKLWEDYKVQIQESEIIKKLIEDDKVSSKEGKYCGEGEHGEHKEKENLGDASENGEGRLSIDPYLKTELIKKNNEERIELENKIKGLQELLNMSREEAKRVIDASNSNNSSIKRPDLFFEARRKDTDAMIREEIVPQLMIRFNIDKDGSNLKKCRLFTSRGSSWIPTAAKNNGGMLAIYFNDYLRKEIGKGRSDWDIEDYERAVNMLPKIQEYVENVLDTYLN